ncbi:MAG: hypothetical protein ACT4PE_18385 [Candidatus Eiseniibacteriota bacterium]
MRTSCGSRFAVASALALLLAPPAFAQKESLDDLDRQIDKAQKDSTAPNTELWEEYQKNTQDDDLSHSTERVEIGGSIRIERDEYIEGDVVAVGGQVTVLGHVEGDVVAVGGDVVLEDGAKIEGDAVAVGGKVREQGSAEVLGESVSVDIPFANLDWARGWGGWHGDFDSHTKRWFSFSWDIAFLAAALLVSLLIYALAGKRLEVVSRRIDEQPGQSFLIGLLGACATPFALVFTSILLIVTIIGILLVPVLVICVGAMIASGFVAAALTVGRRVVAARQKSGELGPVRGSYFHIFVGFLALSALDILSTLLDLGGPAFVPFSLLVGVLGLFILTFASILGYGALISSRFGTERALGTAPPAGPRAPFAQASPPPPPPPPPFPPAPEAPRPTASE